MALKILCGIALLLGAVGCFSGYRSKKIMLPAWSFLVGAAGGWCLIRPEENEISMQILTIALMVVMGVALAVLVVKVGGDSIAVYNGVLFAVAGIALLIVLQNGINPKVPFKPEFVGPAMIIIGVSIFAGLISLYFRRSMTIISTALSGACVLLVATPCIYGIYPTTTKYLVLILFISLATAGLFVQNKTAELK